MLFRLSLVSARMQPMLKRLSCFMVAESRDSLVGQGMTLEQVHAHEIVLAGKIREGLVR